MDDRKGSVTVSAEDNKALLRRFHDEVFNQRHLGAVDDFMAPNHVDHTLPPSLPSGPEGSKRAIGMLLRAFPDLRLTVEDMIAEGDTVVTRFTSRGTQRGPFAIIAPASRHVAIETVDIQRVADGKLVEEWGLDDRFGMLQQLGVIPAVIGLVFLGGLGVGLGQSTLARRVHG